MRKKKNKTNIIMLILVVLVFIISAVFFFKSFDFTEILNNKRLYIYNSEPNIDYSVKIFENSMFSEEELPMGEAYVANVVNDIPVSFVYNFNTNYTADLKYNYKVEALISQYALSGKDKEETSIWSETYTYVEPTEKSINGSNIYIKENIIFDYDYYRELIKLHNKVVNSSSSVAEIKMTINISGKINNNDFKETKELILEIPLDQEVFEISVIENKENVDVYKYENPSIKVDKKMALITAALLSISVFLIIIFGRKIRYSKQNYYTITLSKILKEYGDVIIEVLTPADLNKSTTIEVRNFNEMIDLEERLRIPINFCEVKKNKEGLFWLRYNDQYYKFILKNK